MPNARTHPTHARTQRMHAPNARTHPFQALTRDEIFPNFALNAVVESISVATADGVPSLEVTAELSEKQAS